MEHTTPSTTKDAVAIQKNMRKHVILRDEFEEVKTLVGIDVGYDLKNNMSKCALVLMDADSLEIKQSVIAHEESPFPYISGLLSFREAPVILKALSVLGKKPDLLMIDGQGVAHPRRLGIAAHIGVLTDLPAIGVAKSRLCGHYDEPPPSKGAHTPLTDKGEYIGTVLRSRDNVKPLFISAGHKISQETALKWVINSLWKYRLPEPTRLADKLSKYHKG
ncbi:MAG: deoxyribonuclease V [Alphaproteobacteria bacterium]|nr:deoxyribonuclease V [Alphaproteobacteria bacterium]|tara:strand:- start:1629 stop:2285 length:657 start_codon:yes stop_codon:yes gene_type:complete